MGRGSGIQTNQAGATTERNERVPLKVTSENQSGRTRKEGQGQLVIVFGIPGSGKSTYIKTLENVRVVSADAIRKEIFSSLRDAHGEGLSEEKKFEQTKRNNQKVFGIFNRRITEALSEGKTVVADATNLHPGTRKGLRRLARQQDALMEIAVFKNYSRAFHWNKRRDPDAVVPDAAMSSMLKAYKGSLDRLKNENYDIITTIE